MRMRWCAECRNPATQTIEFVVLGVSMQKDLCELHLDLLLGGARPTT
jgi:hypothetical protein